MGEAKEAGGGDHVERIAILSRQHRGGWDKGLFPLGAYGRLPSALCLREASTSG